VLWHEVHIMLLLHLVHWIQSAQFVCFGHKSRSLKMSYIPNRWDIQQPKQQTKQRIQSKVLIFCYTTCLTICLHSSRNKKLRPIFTIYSLKIKGYQQIHQWNSFMNFLITFNVHIFKREIRVRLHRRFVRFI